MVKKLYILRIVLVLAVLIAAIAGMSMNTVNTYMPTSSVDLNMSELDNIETAPPINVTREDKGDETVVSYRLGILPIRKVNVKVKEDKYVLLGGKPLGIAMGVGGMIVTQKMDVVTSNGVKSPFKDVDVRKGDILTHVNGIRVSDTAALTKALSLTGDLVTVSFIRDGQALHYSVTPAIDALSGTKKIGLWLRADVEGIGTLTYVYEESGRYGALGHVIKDYDSGKVYANPDGNIYESNIQGVVKGERGKAGELSGTFSKVNSIGTIDTNCDFGIFGEYSGDTEGMERVLLGSKYSVRPGKASVRLTIDGNAPDYYDIEIIKNSIQTSAKTKGMLIRVTDKRLLESAGGIVQGMSGSPIVQNGKLVGAVTHVFVADPTKGYATYIDWMNEHTNA